MPKKQHLKLPEYRNAINWASQTALRDVIGKTMLRRCWKARDKMSSQLQKIIDDRTEPWGINVISVEVKDVKYSIFITGRYVNAGPGRKRTPGKGDPW